MTRRADLYTRLSYALAWVRGPIEAAPAGVRLVLMRATVTSRA